MIDAKLGRSSGPHKSEDEQRAFFHAALDRTLTAEANASPVERYYALAGFVLHLKFSGDTLARCFTPALAHLEVPSTSRPDAVFHIWDSESTRTDMLPPPCSHGCFTNRGDVWTMGSRRFKTAYLWSEYALNLFDTVTATGVYWTPAAKPLPYWAKASPLRCLFHWWAETKGCQLVHAAAIGCEGKAVLITGKGGSGKSTTALSCLGKDLSYVGDDYVVVELNPAPTVHSLYCTAKLSWDQMARFPRFADLTGKHDGSDSAKAVMYLFPEMQGQLARSLPLQAILTPRISHRPETKLGVTSGVALHRAAAFTTMSQLPHAGQHTHQFIQRLVERLPGHELAVGSNLDTIADVIVQLLMTSRSEINGLSNGTDRQELDSRPLISVIIPVNNSAQFLVESVASVLAQRYSAVEIIIVGDGSSDAIAETVCRLPVDVRFLKQRHAGLAAARNRGIREASGALVTFLDGNLWPEGHLQRLIRPLLDDSSCDVVQGFGQFMKVEVETGCDDYPGNPGGSLSSYPNSVICRRAAFQTVGLFDQELGFGEDSDWCNRAREHGLRIRQVDQVTLIRRHGAETTRGKPVRELNTLRVLKKALDRERSEGRLRLEDSAPSSGERFDRG